MEIKLENIKQHKKSLIVVGLVGILIWVTHLNLPLIDVWNKERITNKILADVGREGNQAKSLKWIHELMHPLIIAKEEWGRQYVTPQNIDNALIMLEDAKDIEFYEEIKEGLLKMKDANFEDALNIHNLIWNYQHGTIGEGKELDTEALDIITEKYFK